MKVKEWHILLGLVALTALVQPVLADSDAVRGTWSGRWTPESGQRPVTVRFVQDGDAITGEMLNPEQLTFDSVTFDSEELSVVAEVSSSEHGHFKIEAIIEKETRLNGTLTHDGVAADVRLTKWTYRP